MIVPVSADRGLCGGFNSSINREAFKLVKSLEKMARMFNLCLLVKRVEIFSTVS